MGSLPCRRSSKALAEDIMERFLKDRVLFKAGKYSYDIIKEKVNNPEACDIKQEVEVQHATQTENINRSAYEEDYIYMKALDHALPMDYLTVSKLQNNLDREVNQHTVQKLSDKMTQDVNLKDYGDKRLGKHVVHSASSNKKLLEVKKLIDGQLKEMEARGQPFDVIPAEFPTSENKVNGSICGGLHSIGSGIICIQGRSEANQKGSLQGTQAAHNIPTGKAVSVASLESVVATKEAKGRASDGSESSNSTQEKQSLKSSVVMEDNPKLKLSCSTLIVTSFLPFHAVKNGNKWIIEDDVSPSFASRLYFDIIDDTTNYWVGCISSNEDIEHEDEDVIRSLLRKKFCVPIFLKSEVRRDWISYCSGVMHPLLNYSDIDFEALHCREAYSKACLAYKEVLNCIYEKGSRIIVQDYHFLDLPLLLKDLVVKVILLLHTPVPSLECLEILPSFEKTLSSMLKAKRIVFYKEEFKENFILACEKKLNAKVFRKSKVIYDENTVELVVLGMRSRFVNYLNQEANKPATKVFHKALTKEFEGKQVLLSIDSLDKREGIIMKLRAFKHFLEIYKEWQNKVVFLLVITPLCPIVQPKHGHQHYNEIFALADEVNSTFKYESSYPVHLEPVPSLPGDSLTGYYFIGDIFVDTPVRDTLMFKSGEFIYSHVRLLGKKPKVITNKICSSSFFVGRQYRINVLDFNEFAGAINSALTGVDAENSPFSREPWSSNCVDWFLRASDI